jgi:hypothetical protein
MNVLTVWDCVSTEAWRTGSSEAIIDDFYWELQIFNCVTKTNPNVPNFKLIGQLPLIELCISDN